MSITIISFWKSSYIYRLFVLTFFIAALEIGAPKSRVQNHLRTWFIQQTRIWFRNRQRLTSSWGEEMLRKRNLLLLLNRRTISGFWSHVIRNCYKSTIACINLYQLFANLRFASIRGETPTLIYYIIYFTIVICNNVFVMICNKTTKSILRFYARFRQCS